MSTKQQNKSEIAFRTLLVHSQQNDTGGEIIDVQLKDLLCNFMHLADEYAIDFDQEVLNAKAQYVADIATVIA